MAYKKFLKGISALALVLCLILSGCSDDSDNSSQYYQDNNNNDNNNNNNNEGILTITDMPQGYVLSWGSVMNKSDIKWRLHDWNASDASRDLPYDDDYYPYLIGRLHSINGSFNTATISPSQYKLVNGVWTGESLQGGFKYTGGASVYVYFETGQDAILHSWGWNDVSFANGNATVKFPKSEDIWTSDIDSALVGTSWKDNIDGNTITISFTNDSITWGGTAGSALNSETSAYQGAGYTFVWVAKNGTISYKYSYNGGTAQTFQVYNYTLSEDTLELQSVDYTSATLVPDNSGGQNPGGGGLTSDIDSALAGTSWKDNNGGDLITISFADNGITWGGTVGSALNSATSTYQGAGYTFVWVAKNGTISYKYSYMGYSYTVQVYTYTLSENTLELKASGTTFATMIPA